MDAPPSPNHVFNFPEVEFEEDPQEEPEEEFEEDPEEDLEEGPEEDPEAEAEDDVPPPATLPVGSEIARLDGNTELLLSNVQYLKRCEKKRKVDMETCSSEIREGDEIQFSNVVEHRVTDLENREHEKDKEMVKVKKHLGMLEANYSLVLIDRDGWRKAFLNLQAWVFERLGRGAWDARPDVGDEIQFSNVVEHRVTDLENREHEKDEEMVKVKKRLGMLEANYSLVLIDRDGWRKAFLNLQAWVFERLGRGAWDARPDVGDDGPVSFRESKPTKPRGSPSSSH
nr:hypothetical protein [Tanacetum cinerariifolium]